MRALLIRDIRLALRSAGGFGLSLAFFLILVLLVPFAVGPDTALLSAMAPGILWLGALLACLLSLDRLFQLDWEDGALDLLATAPLPLPAAVLAKAAAHWLTTGLPLTLIAPALGLMLNLAPTAWPALVATLALGTPALSLLGAFGAALTVGLKRGGLLLSLLVLPLYIPTLIFGALAVARAAQGAAWETPMVLVASVTALCAGLVPVAAAAALRVNLR
jgi:heme exporter protein B